MFEKVFVTDETKWCRRNKKKKIIYMMMIRGLFKELYCSLSLQISNYFSGFCWGRKILNSYSFMKVITQSLSKWYLDHFSVEYDIYGKIFIYSMVIVYMVFTYCNLSVNIL